MAAPTYTLPTLGSDTSVSDPLIRTALSDLKTLLTDSLSDDNIATGGIAAGSLAADAVTAAKIGSDAVTTAKILNANVTDAKLASPNNNVYRKLASGTLMGSAFTGALTGTYMLGMTTYASSVLATTSNAAPFAINVEAASLLAGSLTTKLRLQAQVVVGSTSPSTLTVQLDLRRITVSAGNYSLGSANGATGSPSPALATNTVSFYNSGAGTGDFTIPTDGLYAVVMTIGSVTVPAGIGVHWQLQARST